MSRKKELQDRIYNLEKLLKAEEKSSSKSQTYIDDLKLTIKQCKIQLSNLSDNPSEFEKIEGFVA